MIKTQYNWNSHLGTGNSSLHKELEFHNSKQYDYNNDHKAKTGDDIIAMKYKLNNIMNTINKKMTVRIRSQERRFTLNNLDLYVNKQKKSSSISLFQLKRVDNERSNKTKNQLDQFSINKISNTNVFTNPGPYNYTNPEIVFNCNQIKNYNKEYRSIIDQLVLKANRDNNYNDKLKLDLKCILSYIADKDKEIHSLKEQLKYYDSIIDYKDIEIKQGNDKNTMLLNSILNNNNKMIKTNKDSNRDNNNNINPKAYKKKELHLNKTKAKV